MSEEITEVLRLWIDAFKERRVPKEILASSFVMENATTAVTARTYFGATGIEEWFGDFFGVLEDGWDYDLDLVKVGDDCAVAKINLTGRGRASGAPLDLSHWGVAWVAGGKVMRAVGFASKREALEAAGLSE